MLKKGDQLSLISPELHHQLYAEIQADDIATLIYTSGSTGYPKGVQLTHRNLCSQIAAAIQRYPLDHVKDRALSALPLAHCWTGRKSDYWESSAVKSISKKLENVSKARTTEA